MLMQGGHFASVMLAVPHFCFFYRSTLGVCIEPSYCAKQAVRVTSFEANNGVLNWQSI